jgi:hypothetical protein
LTERIWDFSIHLLSLSFLLSAYPRVVTLSFQWANATFADGRMDRTNLFLYYLATTRKKERSPTAERDGWVYNYFHIMAGMGVPHRVFGKKLFLSTSLFPADDGFGFQSRMQHAMVVIIHCSFQICVARKGWVQQWKESLFFLLLRSHIHPSYPRQPVQSCHVVKKKKERGR